MNDRVNRLALGALLVTLAVAPGAHAQSPSERLRDRCTRATAPDWNHWALAGALFAVGAGWSIAGFADPARYEDATTGLMQGLGIGTVASSVALAIRLGAPEPIDSTVACRRLRTVRAHSLAERRALLRVERQLRWLGRYGRGWTRGALIAASALTVVGAGVALATALGAQPPARFAAVTGAAFGLSLGFWLAPLVPAPAVRAGMIENAWALNVARVPGGSVAGVQGRW